MNGRSIPARVTATGDADLRRVGRLLEQIASDLAAAGIEAGGLRAFASSGPPVADASTKAVIEDRSGNPEAVLLLADRATPTTVRRSTARAREVAEHLGPALGSVVLQPLFCGDFEGLSYAVLPWRRALAASPLRRRAQMVWLVPRLLHWLRAVVRATVCDASEAQLAERVRDPLQRLVGDERFSGEMRRDAEAALVRIASGQWRPRFVLAHDDLWAGNILLPRDRSSRRASAYGFHLIDWAGAQISGFAFWDLTKLAASLSLPRPWARREIRLHADLLGCQPRDALSYLLLNVADLGGRLEHMPVERYVEESKRLHRALRSWVPPTEPA